MRIRLIIFVALLVWVASQSRFSPSFFWTTVQSSLASMAEKVDFVLKAKHEAQPVAAASSGKAPKQTSQIIPASFTTDIEPVPSDDTSEVQ